MYIYVYIYNYVYIYIFGITLYVIYAQGALWYVGCQNIYIQDIIYGITMYRKARYGL